MDKFSFEALVKQYSKRIYNYLLKTVRNKEDAEDLLQDVFMAFYKKIDSVQEKSYLPYLYQTAYHKALNHISSRKRGKKFLDTLKTETIEVSSSEQQDRSSLVRKVFQKLNPKEALILELQFFQKLSYKEIADILETSVSAVDSKLVRAKKKLKKLLAQEIEKHKVSNYRGDNYEQKVRL